ncbi:Arc family DNA-binding protein [Yersinia pseudotuberculosis]|uniref:Arc family DNA-binding protein n=1 Tax=Yersinia pseudotuberculosis TaxID=633 RepID=UPI0005DF048A|nr:Arc family DNA-binding protein [Yersinia pseudotuberculosis]CND37793.1 transcriptional regulator [Yersinia pseudotuberculosis]CNK54282.1 transcriptional regulator [Yersinia pseudotuberculosis]CQH06629.1 transcriptional regulator [Yersinia pseudotuberculosis]
MSKFPSQEMDRFNVRLPSGMRDAIAERAKQNGRSMNSELILIIEQALNAPIPYTTDNSKFMKAYENLSKNMPKNEIELKDWMDEMTKLTYILMENISELGQSYQALQSLRWRAENEIATEKRRENLKTKKS